MFLFSVCVCVHVCVCMCSFAFVIVCLVLCLPSVFAISTACPQWGQTQVLQEQTPVDDPHAEVGIKPQLNSKGSVAKEEGQKPFHQLYKVQIKFI